MLVVVDGGFGVSRTVQPGTGRALEAVIQAHRSGEHRVKQRAQQEKSEGCHGRLDGEAMTLTKARRTSWQVPAQQQGPPVHEYELPREERGCERENHPDV